MKTDFTVTVAAEHKKIFAQEEYLALELSETMCAFGDVVASCLDLSVAVPDMYEGVVF